MRTEITPYRNDPKLAKVALYDCTQAEKDAARRTVCSQAEVATWEGPQGQLLIRRDRKETVLKLFRKG